MTRQFKRKAAKNLLDRTNNRWVLQNKLTLILWWWRLRRQIADPHSSPVTHQWWPCWWRQQQSPSYSSEVHLHNCTVRWDIFFALCVCDWKNLCSNFHCLCVSQTRFAVNLSSLTHNAYRIQLRHARELYKWKLMCFFLYKLNSQ